MEKRKEKAKESIQAVLPILFIVLLLSFTVAPVSASILLEFMIGAVFVIIGMLFFSMGAEMSMSPMGERVGGSMLKTKKLWVILLLGFFLGVIITISEPDLQVLAAQVPSVPNMVLILSVAAGVGAFLVVALLRILFGIALAALLVVFYGVIFVIARFVPDNFLAVAFDSGGVTTGPMTVPFIMALGVGISAIRNDKHAENDSFGLVALCSIGPVLAVLLLGLVYPAQGSYVAAGVPEAFNSVELGRLFLSEIPYYLKEIAGSLLPIVFFFGIFQLVSIQLHKKTLIKICVGLLYTYVGLVLFLTGANVGFIPAGNYLGTVMASLPCPWILVPVGMVIGYFIVKAEPAVYVLMKQVEEKMYMKVTSVYGLTEAAPGMTATRIDDSFDVRCNTVGRDFEFTEVRVIDPETGEECPVGVQGEMCNRGYNTMKGYYKNPEATAEVIDKDNFLHSGDLGIKDEDGNYRITGRIKDMIIRGGENIYPREIEEFLYKLDGVKDVQVAGIPSKKYGEAVGAFIILQEGVKMHESDVRDFCKNKISRYKIPKYVFFVKEFPMTGSGKIQKFRLKDLGLQLCKEQGIEII
mgnify:FL=1